MFLNGQELRTVETRVCVKILCSKTPSLYILWKLSCYLNVIYVKKKLSGVAKRKGASGAIVILNVKICMCKILLKRYVLSEKEIYFYNQEFTRKAIALKISNNKYFSTQF